MDFRKAQGRGVAEQIPQPQWPRGRAKVLEELRSSRPVPQLPGLFGSQARGEQSLHFSGLINEGDDAILGVSQRPGALQHLSQDGLEFEALIDAQAGLAQPGEALSLHGVSLLRLTRHSHTRLPHRRSLLWGTRRWIRGAESGPVPALHQCRTASTAHPCAARNSLPTSWAYEGVATLGCPMIGVWRHIALVLQDSLTLPSTLAKRSRPARLVSERAILISLSWQHRAAPPPLT